MRIPHDRSRKLIEKQTNWAGNYIYSAAQWHLPKTVAEVQEVVKSCIKLRAVGSRHSFNGIADSSDNMVSLVHCNQILELDREQRTVTVEAGILYGQLARVLHAEGYALHNLASLPHISVAGACATATHGSGVGNGNLATAVRALEFVSANGDRVSLSRDRDPETFPGAVVGLGAPGVVTQMTLAIHPTFSVRQDVYENLPMDTLLSQFDAIVSSAYSVSLFTDWRGATINQLWLKSVVTESDSLPAEPERFGATLATVPRHPLIEISAENCTQQLGAPGPWHERLPHFRMDFMPSAGEELQTEYLVPRRHAVDSLRALYEIREQIAPLLQISEIRTVAADDLWMSPCYHQDCVALHFTWLKDWPAVRTLLPQIEAALEPFEARPHWGKLFTTPPARLQSLYTKLPDFQRLVQSYDPQGKFRNDFLDMLFL
ncbi:MAG: sorbitol oxidase [Chthonomonadales bacterium]|nr:sorbitol oxidase [Chthonomonadales bacterium]